LPALADAGASALSLIADLDGAGARRLRRRTTRRPDKAIARRLGVEEVVVTASRARRRGFEAPTPTTVVGRPELALGARCQHRCGSERPPQVKATFNPTNTVRSASWLARRTVDLRGIGSTRTLSLAWNGTASSATTNLNTGRSTWLKRVEVGDGGASGRLGIRRPSPASST